jgi:hypothetical protein
MIRSAAIVKKKNPASPKEVRLQRRKLKKKQAAERKATKQVRPSPINKRALEQENLPPNRSELEAKATELNLKFDGRTPDKKLFKMIEESLKGQ